MSRIDRSPLIEDLESRQLLSTFTVMNTDDAGAGSLRQAVLDANSAFGADTIEFDASLQGQTVALTTGHIQITDALNIRGTDSSGNPLGVRVSGSFTSRHFVVADNDGNTDIAVTISDLALWNGRSTNSDGGSIWNGENLTLNRMSLVLNNTAGNPQSGGAIENTGVLTIQNSYFSANSATGDGGAISNDGRSPGLGGATLTIINSTLTNNSANQSGGAIMQNGRGQLANLVIQNSTIAYNKADADLNNPGGHLGGGVMVFSSGTFTMISSLLAGNYKGTTNTPDEINLGDGFTPFTPATNNLVQDAATAGGLVHGVNGNIVGQAAMLVTSPQTAGGPTQTFPLMLGSPALDAGLNPLSLTSDQRSNGFVRESGAGVDIGAFEVQNITVVVDSSSVTSDGFFGPGQLTLPEAFTITNNNPGADTVTFDSSLNGSTITLAFQLNIGDDLSVIGPGAGKLAIDGGGVTRVLLVDDFDYTTQKTVSISGVTIQNGSLAAGNFGAGIATEDDLTLTDVVVTGNTLVNGSADLGAGIYNGFLNGPGANLSLVRTTVSNNTNGFGAGVFSDGNLTLTDSTVSGNTSEFSGGGLQFNGTFLVITGSTIDSNTAAFGGGGIFITFGAITISNSTISGNATTGGGGGGGINESGAATVAISNSTIAFNSDSAGFGGGIVTNVAGITLTSTIVANNSNGGGTASDIGIRGGGINAASSNNLIADAASAGGLVDGTNNNIVGQDPRLAALASNGGFTRTNALLAGSPAIDTGAASSGLTLDQRGSVFTRSSGTAPDIGAYERQTLNLVVDTAEAIDDGDISAGDLSIREALSAANGNPLDDTISFDASLANSTITLFGSSLPISDDVTINGLGSGQLRIDGNANSRIFTVTDGDSNTTINVEINGLALTNGSISNGGAIDNLEHLTLTDIDLSGNNATNDGGAIHNTGTLVIVNSTISNNTAADSGGAIDNDGTTTVTITDSSLTANMAGGAAGAIDNDANGTLTITDSTFSSNTAGSSGGVIDNDGTLTITDSTFSDNVTGSSGGAIDNDGMLTVTGSSFIDNQSTDSAGGYGGAIRNTTFGVLAISGSLFNGNSGVSAGGAIENNGTATISNSTLDSNSAADAGGAIENFGGTITITGSTLSNNTVSGSGGGIWTDTALTVQSSTISGNVAGDFGGGIGMFDGTVVIANSTLANNVADADDDGTGQGGAIDVGKRGGAGTLVTTSTIYANNMLGTSGPVANDITLTDGTVTGSNNIVKDQGTAGGLTNGVNGNLVGVDPQLGELADNGGPTMTHAIFPSSAAWNAGIASGAISTDQRGEDRTQGTNPDIGAYEWAPSADFSLKTLDGSTSQSTSIAGGEHISVMRNADGDLVVFVGNATTWSASKIRDYTPAPAVTGDPVVWTDPGDGLVYVAAPSAEGFILHRRAADGSWSFRNLSTETSATNADSPQGVLAFFVTRPKSGSAVVAVAGLTASGEIVAFQQTGTVTNGAAEWMFVNISDDLTSQSMTTPAFTQMTSYVTSWNQWTLAGLDAAGNVQGVWVNVDTFSTWRVDNLSTITGSDALTGELDVTLTTWGGIRFSGADANGNLVATWWNPALGAGNWIQTDLTSKVTGTGPALVGGWLTAWFTPSNQISYAGYSSTGDVLTYHWEPSDGAVWNAGNITDFVADNQTRPVGSISAYVSSGGTVSIVAADSNNNFVRLWSTTGADDDFLLASLTDLAVRA